MKKDRYTCHLGHFACGILIAHTVLVVLPRLSCQSTWTMLNTLSTRIEYGNLRMIDLPAQGVVLAHGGVDYSVPNFRRPLSDTWVWNGSQWTRLTPTTIPPARWGAGVAYDPVRNIAVRFGGMDAAHALHDDTWVWQNGNWREVYPATRPGARIPVMQHDPIRGGILMFGGLGVSSAGSFVYQDTWLFDGSDWTQLHPATAFPAKQGSSAVVDSHRGRIVFFAPMPYFQTTWEWDGVNWQMIPVTTSPRPLTAGNGMAYDPERRRVVVYGGEDNSGVFQGSLWEYDGVDWRMRQDSTMGPGERTEFGFVYSTINRATLVFGGYSRPVPQVLNRHDDVWAWQTNRMAEFDLRRPGCPGIGLQPTLRRPLGGPWLGDDYMLAVEDLFEPSAGGAMLIGFSDSRFGSQTLPLSLSSLGMGSCQLAVAAEITYPLSQGGFDWQWQVRVPTDPGLAGIPLFHQAAILQSRANPAGAVMTNSYRATIGIR